MDIVSWICGDPESKKELEVISTGWKRHIAGITIVALIIAIGIAVVVIW